MHIHANFRLSRAECSERVHVPLDHVSALKLSIVSYKFAATPGTSGSRYRSVRADAPPDVWMGAIHYCAAVLYGSNNLEPRNECVVWKFTFPLLDTLRANTQVSCSASELDGGLVDAFIRKTLPQPENINPSLGQGNFGLGRTPHGTSTHQPL